MALALRRVKLYKINITLYLLYLFFHTHIIFATILKWYSYDKYLFTYKSGSSLNIMYLTELLCCQLTYQCDRVNTANLFMKLSYEFVVL